MRCLGWGRFYKKAYIKVKVTSIMHVEAGTHLSYIYLCSPLQCIAFTCICCFITYGWLGMNILRAAYETDSGIMLMCPMLMTLEW